MLLARKFLIVTLLAATVIWPVTFIFCTTAPSVVIVIGPELTSMFLLLGPGVPVGDGGVVVVVAVGGLVVVVVVGGLVVVVVVGGCVVVGLGPKITLGNDSMTSSQRILPLLSEVKLLGSKLPSAL